MITLKEQGNIFHSKMQTLTCPVNTVGVMGKGLALGFKQKYPSLLEAYQFVCQNGSFAKNGLFVHAVSIDLKILCFPTKRHWRFPSKLHWIEHGLKILTRNVERYGITSLAIPALGCGEGKLEWEDVNALLIQYLTPLDIPIEIYTP